MSSLSKNSFTRGMAILLLIVFATALIFYSAPAQAGMRETDDVSVSGDLDDVGGFKTDTGGGSSTGELGGRGVVSESQLKVTKTDDGFVFTFVMAEFMTFWMIMTRK